MKDPNKVFTLPEIRQRIYKYCAYQDRSIKEVKAKLRELGCPSGEVNEIMQILVREKYLDEERFCKSFVRGKFFHKSWSIFKIKMALSAKGIQTAMADKTIREEIPESELKKMKEKLIEKKSKQLADLPEKERKLKIRQFLFRKGFGGE